ncbi:MAG TPA: helix-turn-helix transcriptional regulator [Mucilaginibacter sp.]|nr:helix-turn-helix transcriptional regulator [Mucilaginibacter sp.]
MSKPTTETFGETIRKLREDNQMPLRKLAALLDIDQSTLSKIERNERKANDSFLEKISSIFGISKKDLHLIFISDKIAYDLLEEENIDDIFKVAEEKITYLKQSKNLTHD